MSTKLQTILILTFTILFVSCVKESSDEKIDKIISKMTLKQKLELLGGTGFATKEMDSLGIPSIKMTDGPMGVRWDNATAFPSGIALASTWDTSLARQIGVVLGKETKAKGRDMLLGPCINIVRTPVGGRNFETYGEDPFLNGRIAVSWIQGLQSEKVLASVKHFAVNNQEHERMSISAEISERALYEVYLPAFKMAVQEGDAKTVMSAYNKVNGVHAAENNWLLDKVLKGEWNYQGFVVSDWGAVHSSLGTAKNGNDLEMPDGKYMNPDSLTKFIQNGELKESVINDKVKRILRGAFWAGLDKKDSTRYNSPINTDDHKLLARKAATESIVLLKNEKNILPIVRSDIKSIAVIGPNANEARTGGGGSSMVNPFYSVSILDAIKEKVGSSVDVRFAKGVPQYGDISLIPFERFSHDENGKQVKGLKGEYFSNKELSGTPYLVRTDSIINFAWGNGSVVSGMPVDNYSARWTGYLTAPISGKYRIDALSDDGVRVWLDNKLIIDNWRDHAAETKSASFNFTAGKKVQLKVEFYENGGDAVVGFGWDKPGSNLLAESVEVAKSSDMVILCVGTSYNQESEGFDRSDINLPVPQEELVRQIAAVNPRTIVVLNNGQPLAMEKWLGSVSAVVEAWFGGQETGHGVADVLFGDAIPSGKLTVSFPRKIEDNPSYPYYPGKDGKIEYGEGIYVGYRYYETKGIEPQFPFGFGLSYTTYEYKNLTINKTSDGKYDVGFIVRNSGNVAGSEITQLYVHDIESSTDRPVKELKGFSKVYLNPGEEKEIKMVLDDQAFSFYSEKDKRFIIENGDFEIMIGASVKDIRLTDKLTIKN